MKKTMILIASFMTILMMSACGDTGIVDNEDPLGDAYDALIIDTVLVANGNGETVLPTTSGTGTVTWTSNFDGILQSNILMHSGIARNITLSASITVDGRTMIKHFDVSVSVFIPGENPAVCTSNQTLVNGECVNDDIADSCNSNEELINGLCVAVVTDPICTVNETLVNGACVLNDDDNDDTGAEIVYDGYYEGVEGLSGDTLKTFLHNLIDDHTSISYSAVSEALKFTDIDPYNQNNIILLYSGDSIDKDYRCSSSCPSDSWNKEHVWPQSVGGFDTGDVPGTDLHSLRPTYVPINSARLSKDFDEGGTEVYFEGTATGNYTDSNSFEPRDDVKGDVARMMFYMAVRYQGDDGYADLEIDEIVGDGAPTIGVLSVLLQWHLDDPVDSFEENRNNVIYDDYQGNRNPFIDHPELVALIWGN